MVVEPGTEEVAVVEEGIGGLVKSFGSMWGGEGTIPIADDLKTVDS